MPSKRVALAIAIILVVLVTGLITYKILTPPIHVVDATGSSRDRFMPSEFEQENEAEQDARP